MAHGLPGEEQVGHLLQRGLALGDDAPLDVHVTHDVGGLDQQPAADAAHVHAAEVAGAESQRGRRRGGDGRAGGQQADIFPLGQDGERLGL